MEEIIMFRFVSEEAVVVSRRNGREKEEKARNYMEKRT